MNSSRYTAPQAPVNLDTPATGSPVKAVLFGLLVDFGGTVLASMIISAAYVFLLLRSSMGEKDIETALTQIDPFSPFGLVLGVAGLFCSFWGGYICALHSRIRVLRDTAMMSVLTVGLGTLLSDDNTTFTQELLMTSASVVAIYAGAGLWVRIHR